MESVSKEKAFGSCDTCLYNTYDEEYDCYMCTVNMDEDEMAEQLGGRKTGCPYYRLYDEYGTVRKQN